MLLVLSSGKLNKKYSLTLLVHSLGTLNKKYSHTISSLFWYSKQDVLQGS